MKHYTLWAACAVLIPTLALAAPDLDSPKVTKGEVDIGMETQFDLDHRDSKNGALKQDIGVGYGFTDWFVGEIEFIANKEPNDAYRFTGIEIETVFEILNEQEDAIGLGFEAAYELSTRPKESDVLKAAILVEKTWNQWQATINFGLDQEIGAFHEKDAIFESAWRLKYDLNEEYGIGLEGYHNTDEIGDSPGFHEQEHLIGPAVYGEFMGIGWEAGWLFGISKEAPDHTLKFLLDYEF